MRSIAQAAEGIEHSVKRPAPSVSKRRFDWGAFFIAYLFAAIAWGLAFGIPWGLDWMERRLP